MEENAIQPNQTDVKETVKLIESMTEMFELMGSNPNSLKNFEGLRDVLAQDTVSFQDALLNPLKEQIYDKASPLINALYPMIDDLAGSLGDALMPTFKALADVVTQLQPFIQWLTDTIGRGVGGLFDIDLQRGWDWQEAGYGAIGGLAVGAYFGFKIGYHGSSIYGALIGAGVGGLLGLVLGGAV